ncbi:MAG: substrate-binding domain-containing protein [Mycobacterium leprae]
MEKMGYKVFLRLGDLPGDRLVSLLEAIDRVGSINRATAELKISFRHAWGLIKAAEERLSFPLLVKRVGGVSGGGAALTDDARRLIEEFRLVRANVESQVGHLALHPEAPPVEPDTRHPVLMATTIGPVESGLLPAMEAAFLEETGTPVRHIAAGSGQALQLAREGRVDLVLAHAPQLEAAFIGEGYGVAAYPLMYNDFVLLGPAADPAGVAQASTASAAFQRCGAAQAPFVTRGDQSGTHVHELALWEAAGVQPTSPWYQTCSRGSLGSMAALRYAEQIQAYLLVDRATYLTARAEGSSLALLFAGDAALRNVFSLIPVNPGRFPQVQHDAARRFVTWAASSKGQSLIQRFGVDQFGEPLFCPCATTEG